MVWVGEIEDCVAQQDQKLFVFVHEHASERVIFGLDYDVLSRPLPELGLSRPKWLGVLTDDEGRVLTLLSLFFLFFTFTQCFYPQVRSFIYCLGGETFTSTISVRFSASAYLRLRAIRRAAAS